jgi:hypothetical protein
MASITEKDEFVNVSDGWVGVTTLRPNGDQRGIAVEPGGSTFLTEEEQILTANAPRDDKDNPFANGMLKLRRKAVEIRNRRPFGVQAGEIDEDPEPRVPDEETGATPVPVQDPPIGAPAPGEEVATPAAARIRSKSKA